MIRTVILFFLAGLAAFGQPAAPAFEVASVKASQPDARGSTFNFAPGGGLTVQNGTLRGILESAYDVRDFQITGGPGWMDSARFDIFAKTADPGMQSAGPEERVRQTRLRLQTLLAERFQLKVHRETKDQPVLALTVARNGPKLKEGADDPAVRGAGIRASCGQMVGTRATMSVLAVVLSRRLGRPVVERTGLTGKYNFQLDWTPDEGPCAVPEGSEPASVDAPSLFAALQEQLGLRLESSRGPVEVVVIDGVEKPAEN